MRVERSLECKHGRGNPNETIVLSTGYTTKFGTTDFPENKTSLWPDKLDFVMYCQNLFWKIKRKWLDDSFKQ